MLGAICGDIIGSVYERSGNSFKQEDFPLFSPGCRFTDDSVLTLAVAWAILQGEDYGQAIRSFARKWPRAGYGGSFYAWMRSDTAGPYYSFGNGSAMRVSPVGFAFDSAEEVLLQASQSASPTHNHPEGIKGAQATALAVFMARTGASKPEIAGEITRLFGYDLSRTTEQIRPGYSFDVTCQGSVPEALCVFLDSAGFEDAVRKAVSLGGDTDTQAAIAGAVAEAFYGGVPAAIAQKALEYLPVELKQIMEQFYQKYAQ
ncbi:MAG: ADP-ribosylglycohydrolase family protein [Desulfatibacillaceae bacterium]|nr:ADP-ribosylglycohydrolase family protein [Desulfatibacillaceae bacterium]